MISAQIDELRQMADGQATYRDARAVMLQAADTILSLRDRAQDLQAHNAKLRKERDMYRDLVGMMDHPDLNAQLQAENDRLQECLQDIAEHIREDDGFGLDYGWMLERMRELGVEVDG